MKQNKERKNIIQIYWIIKKFSQFASVLFSLQFIFYLHKKQKNDKNHNIRIIYD